MLGNVSIALITALSAKMWAITASNAIQDIHFLPYILEHALLIVQLDSLIKELGASVNYYKNSTLIFLIDLD